MWKKVDEVIFGDALKMAYTQMNGIANKLINATFSSNSFVDKVETFIKNQLKNLAKFVPIKKLIEFKNKIMAIKNGFEKGAKMVMDGSKQVGEGNGARVVLPMIMALAKRLLDIPVLKEADAKVKELAGALKSVSEGTLTVLKFIPNLADLSTVLEATATRMQDKAAVKAQVVALVKSDSGSVADSPVDPTELFMSLLNQLQPHLESMYKNVFASIRSSTFATSIMKHGEAGLDLAVKFCKYSKPVETIHTVFNKLHGFVFGNTVLNDAQYYISYFTGNAIFDSLNKFDDKITDGCEMVTGITEKYEKITTSVKDVHSLVTTAVSYGEGLTKKLLAMPSNTKLPLDQVVSDAKTPGFELDDLTDETQKGLKLASLDGKVASALGFSDLSDEATGPVSLSSIKPAALAGRTLKSVLAGTGMQKIKLSDMSDKFKRGLTAGDLTDAALKAANMVGLKPSATLKADVLATLGVDALKDEKSSKLSFSELGKTALTYLKLGDIVPATFSKSKLSDFMADSALGSLSLNSIAQTKLETLDISNLKGSILKTISSTGLRSESKGIVDKVSSEGNSPMDQVRLGP